jgi:hypothetical protein
MASPNQAAGYHDVGGRPAGSVDLNVTEVRPWEKLSIVIGNALKAVPAVALTTDQGRRTREEFGEQLYNELGYFERGIEGMRRLLIEKGVLTEDELRAKMKAVAKQMTENGR